MHRCVHVCGSHTQVSTDHALLSETLRDHCYPPAKYREIRCVPLLSSFLLGIHNEVLKTNTLSTEPSTHARDQLGHHTTVIAPA